MANESSQLASRVMAQVEALNVEREGYLRKVAEIDGKLSKVLTALGLSAADFAGANLDRLAAPAAGRAGFFPVDPNTLGGNLLRILLEADKGLTRVELRKELEQVEHIAVQLKNNINGFYNVVGRYLSKGRIVEIGGLIYHVDRAPVAGADSQEEGRLPFSNVTSITAKAAGDNA